MVDTGSEGVADLVEGITAAGVLAGVLDVDASPVHADCRMHFINDEPVIRKAAKIYNILSLSISLFLSLSVRTCMHTCMYVYSVQCNIATPPPITDDLQIERNIMSTRS